ncbi:MAG: hypothetical protein KDB46_05265, partial [Solirubrobacterales bacterium]|nr:hypothetical protein [Solirubrobacterales bacterium]
MSLRAKSLAACACGIALLATGNATAAPAGPGSADRSAGVPKPKLDWDPIPYGKDRKRQMAAYSHRHYGKRTWRLKKPRVIVLHYTATSTYGPVHNAFSSNAPSLGEKPGVCSQ